MVVPDLRDAKGIADVAVLAMPPAYVGPELLSAQECAVADVYTDVASVKVLPVAQARALGCDPAATCPRTRWRAGSGQGPAAAQADLFLGRTWALCPLPETSPDAVAAVTALAVACGAVPGHAPTRPRTTAGSRSSRTRRTWSRSAMAAGSRRRRCPATRSSWPGQGLRDVTRIAAGDTRAVDADPGRQRRPGRGGRRRRGRGPGGRRAPPRAGLPAGTPAELAGAAGVTGLLDRGLAGVGRIPGKHGGQPRNFTVVQVVLADRPGELARLFNAAGAAGVNIEDIRLEHSPGLPVGVAELSVRPDQAVHAA